MQIRSAIKNRIMNSSTTVLLFLLLLFFPGTTTAEEGNEENINDRYALALIFGNAYDPVNNIDFYMLSGSVLYDYKKVWHHKAPDPLRVKVEYSIGIAREKKTYLMTSVNMFALYYLDILEDDEIKPYVEGGIGIIYTGFQVRGQGFKVNFNPQMGLGTEFKTASLDAYFLALRLHHLSNADIADENRGVNSVILMFGRYF